MTAIHIVTDALPPRPGGLERWTSELAGWLVDWGYDVIVYLIGDSPLIGETDGAEGYEVVSLQALRQPWERCLSASGWQGERLGTERARLNFLCLRNAVCARVPRRSRNIVLSNFAIDVGYLAHLVAWDVGLPHILVLAGTDFSRGFRNPRERAILAEVIGQSAVLVVRSEEQSVALRKELDLPRLAIIETGVDVGDVRWQGHSRGKCVKIFSDTGFSFKKGTDILVESFRRVYNTGHPINLSICGSTQQGQENYWQCIRARTKAEYGNDVTFSDYLPATDVLNELASASIYASATLGEGSSASRASALCVGVPILSTLCGELWQWRDQWPHVRLVNVADAEGFAAAFELLFDDVFAGKLSFDLCLSEQAKARFGRDLEKQAWQRVLSWV